MTTLEAQELLGTTGLINRDGLRVPVIVQDVKQSYGQTRYQVTAGGGNSIWVNADTFHAQEFNA